MDQILSSVVKFVLISQIIIGVSNANFVFNVQHKFGGPTSIGRSNLKKIIAHDALRHRRMLSAVDFQLAGNGLSTGTALHYMKLSIGTPPKDYFVDVDTGSNDLWINCVGCETCPKESGFGFNTTLYDLKSSSTGKPVSCNDSFCSLTPFITKYDCKIGGECIFYVAYGDGEERVGNYVRDSFKFDKISGDLKVSSMDVGDIAFGCARNGTQESWKRAVDGIIGFGPGKSSVLSQLAASGKTKRIFSHCLESVKRGGIFAIGEVVEPKVQTTPIVPGEEHHKAYLERIEVGGSVVWNYQNEVAKGGFPNTKPQKTEAIIDTGATLALFPKEVHESIQSKIMEKHPELKTYIEDDRTCFKYYNKNIDDVFPVMSLHFENNATLNTYPHDYLLNIDKNVYCIGLSKTPPQLVIDGKPITLLGNLVLADKLIVYDLEKRTMGFTEYNCSSSIKVKDESSGNVYSVSAHDISNPSSPFYQ